MTMQQQGSNQQHLDYGSKTLPLHHATKSTLFMLISTPFTLKNLSSHSNPNHIPLGTRQGNEPEKSCQGQGTSRFLSQGGPMPPLGFAKWGIFLNAVLLLYLKLFTFFRDHNHVKMKF